jgi:GxxExxY protein
MNENELSNCVIGLAIQVHKILGPGLLESAYKECLYYELINSGFYVKKEKPLPITYKDIKLDYGYRIDLLVEKKLVLEIKSIEEINDIHKAQLLTYIKIGNYKLGLLLNFNVMKMKEGIRRVIN